MAASVDVIEKISATTYTAKTSGTVRFKNANDFAVDNANPMVIPGAGSDWSYEKWLRLRIGDTPPADKIDNVQFYTDGSGFRTGIRLWARSATAFSTPAEPTTATGLVSAFALTVGATLALNGPAATYSGSGTEIGSFVVLSLEVDNTATLGSLTAATVTFSYDEI